MVVAVFVAVVLHAIVILGVSFERTTPPVKSLNSLDILLVPQRTEAAPEDAELLAQANNKGGDEHLRPERQATPIPSPLAGPSPEILASAPRPAIEAGDRAELAEATAVEPTAQEIAEPTPATQTVVSQAQTESQEAMAPRRPRPRAKPASLKRPAQLARAAKPQLATPDAQRRNASRLVSRSLAMASLSAEVDRKLNAYAKRPRSKWISARTRELKYASYMEAWRAKVERIGNLNYPDEARRKGLSGKLVLDVAIKPDGSLKSVTLRRSSGQRVLDDAALHIVRLAAPYAAFPASFKNDVDVLHIERTWRFLGSNHLAAR